MKNKTMGIFVVMFLVIGIVTAGGIGMLSSWQKDITLSKSDTDRIKEVANITKINITISDITCNGEQCYADIYQKDLINTQWRRSINYCSTYSVCALENETGYNESCEIVCLEFTNYTLEENKENIKQYAEHRIGNWSIVQKNRINKTITIKSGLGKVRE